MPGVVELAEQVFDLPVRLGLPHEVQGLKDVVRNPACATAVGLLMYGRQNQPSAPVLPTQGVGRWLHRINDWIKRSEEHTSELQSLMRISYAVFCLKNKNTLPKPLQ